MQAVSVKQVADAKYRSDASLLVNQLIGDMWVGDRTPATLSANFSSPGGAGYISWLSNVTSTLPGIVVNAPAVNAPTVTVDAATGLVTVTIFWLAPNEAPGTIAHQYVAIAQIKN